VNHIANEYALWPMAKKPAEKIAFGEMRICCGFSTEREEPILNDDEEREGWKDNNDARRKNVANKVILIFNASYWVYLLNYRIRRQRC